jgi:ATP-binding cassette subfamily B protein
LREKSQIGKDGVSLLGISEAAEAIGFRTVGVKIPFDKLTTEVPLPCIVHWDQNHFVVVYDVKSKNKWMSHVWGGLKGKPSHDLNPGSFPQATVDSLDIAPERIIIPPQIASTEPPKSPLRQAKIFVADPGKGLITYTAEEFCQGWVSTQATNRKEGIVLVLEPTPDFYQLEDELATSYSLGRVFKYLLQYKKMLIQLFLGLLAGSGLQLIFPFLTQSIVDIGINTENVPFLYLVLGAQLMLTLGRLSVEFIRSWILLHISTRINLNILSDFFIKLMRLPMTFFETKQFGDIMQRIGDHQRIEAFLTGSTLSILFSFINLIIFGVVLAMFNLTIFGIFMLSSLLYMGWVILFLRQRRILDIKRFDLGSKNQSSLIQLIQGMQEIKLAGAERQMRWAWEQLQVRHFRLQMKGLSLSQYQEIGAFAINEGKNILITFLAAKAVINGQLTLGGMLAMQ